MNEVRGTTGSPQVHVIELTLNRCDELFDASAPTCLAYRTVHGDITEHLLQKVGDVPRKLPVKLSLIVPAEELGRAGSVAAEMRGYFEKCCGDEQRRMRRVFWEGRIALVIGLSVLLVGNVIGETIRASFLGQFANAVANGLEIFGWVA